MEAPVDNSGGLRERLAGQGPLLIALVAVVVGLCLLVVFGILLLTDLGGVGVGEDGGNGPTPFPTAAPSVPDDVIIAGVSGSAAISLPVSIPASLSIAGTVYPVRAEPVEEDGTWEPEVGEGTTALWIYGTLINYVIGLPDNAANRELLENLPPGAEIQMTMNSGNQFDFTITQSELVPTTRTDIFGQTTPGITLILLRARGDERLVVRGDYVADVSSVAGGDVPGGNVVELGEPAQLDEMRLTVTDATSLFDRPEAPPGFIFFLLDFQLQNVGNQPVDLGNLRFFLLDDLGNQYALNAQSSQLGTFPPLSGTLLPGETRQATAGYQIPAGLTSPSLTWVVAREQGGGQIRVTIPFAGSGDAAAQFGVIDLQSAEISSDGTALLLQGQIGNSGEQPLLLSESDVSLVSNGTVHLMLSTNPAFPWVIAPGQSIPFALSFQRPAGADAVLTILDRPFQLSGLR